MNLYQGRSCDNEIKADMKCEKQRQTAVVAQSVARLLRKRKVLGSNSNVDTTFSF